MSGHDAVGMQLCIAEQDVRRAVDQVTLQPEAATPHRHRASACEGTAAAGQISSSLLPSPLAVTPPCASQAREALRPALPTLAPSIGA